MVVAIPGGLGLFLTLQDALSKGTPEGRIHLTRPVHDFLADFRLLDSQLDLWPTRIAEIITDKPDYLGAAGAAGVGMGEVWIPDTSKSHALLYPSLLWHEDFLQHIRDNLCSFQNPTRPITNSDLRLAGKLV